MLRYSLLIVLATSAGLVSGGEPIEFSYPHTETRKTDWKYQHLVPGFIGHYESVGEGVPIINGRKSSLVRIDSSRRRDVFVWFNGPYLIHQTVSRYPDRRSWTIVQNRKQAEAG